MLREEDHLSLGVQGQLEQCSDSSFELIERYNIKKSKDQMFVKISSYFCQISFVWGHCVLSYKTNS